MLIFYSIILVKHSNGWLGGYQYTLFSGMEGVSFLVWRTNIKKGPQRVHSQKPCTVDHEWLPWKLSHRGHSSKLYHHLRNIQSELEEMPSIGVLKFWTLISLFESLLLFCLLAMSKESGECLMFLNFSYVPNSLLVLIIFKEQKTYDGIKIVICAHIFFQNSLLD